MIINSEDDYLMMSGLQHFDYCKRQWALIHIEQQWADNLFTAEGNVMHKRCHNEKIVEKRGDLIVTRGMRVVSHTLKLTGVCDVVEYHKSSKGIPINGYDGMWDVVPVEYKHGHPKTIDADRLQLCAQAIALEEMLVCDINSGFLYYGEIRRREQVLFTNDLRAKVKSMAEEMCKYYMRGYTPIVKKSSNCNMCSLKDICLPIVENKRNVKQYILENISGE